MRKCVSLVFSSILLLTACSESEPTLTVQNMSTGEQMKVPGVQRDCPSDERDWAELVIRNFYENGRVRLAVNGVLYDSPECFNDALLFEQALKEEQR